MNQGFPPNDGYGGSARPGGTVPGGPPLELQGGGGQAARPGGTVVGDGFPPVQGGELPPTVNVAPAGPAPVAGGAPIGYPPPSPARAPQRSGGGIMTIALIGLAVAGLGVLGGGLYFYFGASSSGDDDMSGAQPLGSFAPVATIAPEESGGAEQIAPEETDQDSTDDVATNDTPPSPPPATTHRPSKPSKPKPTAPKPTATTKPPSNPTSPKPTSTKPYRPPGIIPGLIFRPPGGRQSPKPKPTATNKPSKPWGGLPRGGFRLPKKK